MTRHEKLQEIHSKLEGLCIIGRNETIGDIALRWARAEQSDGISLMLQECKSNISSGKINADILDESNMINLIVATKLAITFNAVPYNTILNFAKATKKCRNEWRQRKITQDFAGIVPFLKELAIRSKEISCYKEMAYEQYFGLSGSSSLINFNTPHIEKQKTISALEEGLPELLSLARSNKITLPKISKTRQRQILSTLMQKLFRTTIDGIDGNHPIIKNILSGDIYDEKNFTKSLIFAMRKAAAHLHIENTALYFKNQPINMAQNFWIRFGVASVYEKQIVRSLSFCHLVAGFYGMEPHNLHRFMTGHQITGTRNIEDDEISYLAHNVIRAKIEEYIFKNPESVCDIPDLYESLYKKILQIKAKNPKIAIMSDRYWYSGELDYFFSETMGLVFSHQIFSFMQKFGRCKLDSSTTINLDNCVEFMRQNLYITNSSFSSFLLNYMIYEKEPNSDGYLEYLKRNNAAT